MSDSNHLFDRVDRAQHVRNMSQGDKAGAVAEQVLKGLHIHLTTVADGHNSQGNALALPDELPRHDVAVMLHHRDDDFVASLQHLTEGGCHQVDSLGGTAGENHLLHTAGINEGTHLFACEFHKVGGFLRQGVNATVHVGLVVVIHPVNRLDDGTGRLRRGGIVQIDERATLNLALQDREILANPFDI